MSNATTVLIASGDQGLAEFVVWVLRERGLAYQVIVCPDLECVVDQCRRYREPASQDQVGLIVVDEALSDCSGLSAVKSLKSDRHYRAVPVVALTGSGKRRAAGQLLAAGANSVVEKSPSQDKLAEMIGQVAIYWLLVNVPPAPHHRATR